jgi:hypothetical protein
LGPRKASGAPSPSDEVTPEFLLPVKQQNLHTLKPVQQQVAIALAALDLSPRVLPPGHVFAGLKVHHYRCVAIDAPTKFVADTQSRPQHYKRMSDHEIATLPVADLLHPDSAWIFLWVTSPRLYAPAGSRTRLSPDVIARAWGAKYSARGFVWVKANLRAPDPPRFPEDLHKGQGYTTRKYCEDCLIFKVGRPQRACRAT